MVNRKVKSFSIYLRRKNRKKVLKKLQVSGEFSRGSNFLFNILAFYTILGGNFFKKNSKSKKKCLSIQGSTDTFFGFIISTFYGFYGVSKW